MNEVGAFALGLVPENVRAVVAEAREHAWRAQAAAARANEAAAIHADALAWGGGASYSGDVRNGKPDGFGVMTFRRRANVFAWYRGAFSHGVRAGHGMGMSEDGLIWSGEWKNDEACGLGVLEARNGQRYEGGVTPGADGAPKAGVGWSWNAPQRPPTHHAVTQRLAAPHAETPPQT
jgi:hypothetical protein